MTKAELNKRLLEFTDFLQANRINYIIMAVTPEETKDGFNVAACNGTMVDLSWLIFKTMDAHPAFNQAFSAAIDVKKKKEADQQKN